MKVIGARLSDARVQQQLCSIGFVPSVKEIVMRLLLLALLSLLAPAFAQTSTPEIPFETVPDFFKYPSDMNFGELSSVAVNSKGHVFILSRSNSMGNVFGGRATQLFEFDEKGQFIREIGKGVYGFAFGHGVRVDRDDNVWVVDKGTNMVMKFNQTGHVTMALGRREEATDQHEYPDRTKASVQVNGMFNQPTDVAWDSVGNIFISDGYVNSRVAKYDKTGAWVKSWGQRGFAPGEFNLPHNIAVDSSDRVYVADRANGRIQVFDTDGKFLKQIVIDVPAPPGAKPLLGYQIPPAPNVPPGSILTYRPGAPAAICIPPGQSQVMYVGDLFPARIYKLTLDGKVLGVFGRAGKMPGQISGIHGLACPSENVVFTAEFINWRSQKFILHPEKMK